MKTFIYNLIDFHIQNKEKITTFVQNEVFPNGVYRFHKSEVIPVSIERNIKKFKDENNNIININKMIEEVSKEFKGLVFDPSNLWFTLHTQN